MVAVRIDSEGRIIKNLRGLSVDKKRNGEVKDATELFYMNILWMVAPYLNWRC